MCLVACVQLFEAPGTVAHQAPLSMGFSRQEYWSGLLFPPPEAFPDPGMEPMSPESPAFQADGFITAEPSGKPSHLNRWEQRRLTYFPKFLSRSRIRTQSLASCVLSKLTTKL